MDIIRESVLILTLGEKFQGHQGMKSVSVLHLAFWSGTLPAELSSVVNDGQGTK